MQNTERSFAVLLVFSLFAVLPGSARSESFDSFERRGEAEQEPHAHLRRGGFRASRQSIASRSLMKLNGGAILHGSKSKAVFWGPLWANAAFAGDKISGLDLFFTGFSGSRYAGTATEYYDSAGYATSQSTYLGHVLDASAPPNRALKVSEALAEVCKLAANHPDPNAVYFLYTSSTAGNVNYCAWHSWGKCSNGAPLQVAYMPNIDGLAGCDPGDTTTGHSQGLSAVANVTAHEFFEAITDPRGTGWYDYSGYENGDKCAWSFPSGNGVSTFANGSQWKVQMEWSNAAFSAGSGLANLSGQKGCIY